MIDFAPSTRRDFSLSAARSLVQDCFRPKPCVYWTDFVICYGLGIACYQQVRGGSLLVPHQGITGEPWQAICFVVSCLCFYRVALFIHELVHQRTDELNAFRFAWNLLCGIPFLLPTFVYYSHLDHHRRAHYGTEHDGEYLPLVHRHRWFVFYYLSWSFVIPLAVVFRFMILTPLAWASPRLRRWVHRRASSMVMDPSYIRPLPSRATLRTIRVQEFGCCLWCWGVAILPPILMHRTALPFAIHAYLTAVVIILLNSLRTLGSHRWRNAGDEMTFLAQLLDSVNYPNRRFTTELWAPVGSRFHALHHLFPSMPYHEMPRAHRILMEQLPEDSPYRLTNEASLSAAIRQLWRDTRAQSALTPPTQSPLGIHSAASGSQLPNAASRTVKPTSRAT